MDDLGLIMRRLRIASGRTQQDIADILGCSRQAVTHLETGRRRLRWEQARTICNGLGYELRPVKRCDGEIGVIAEFLGWISVNPSAFEVIATFMGSLDEEGRDQLAITANAYMDADESIKGEVRRLLEI